MVSVEIVLVDGDVFEVELLGGGQQPPTLDNLLHCVNQHSLLQEESSSGEGSSSLQQQFCCWRLVDEEGAVLRCDADVRQLMEGGETPTLLGLTRPRGPEDDDDDVAPLAGGESRGFSATPGKTAGGEGSLEDPSVAVVLSSTSTSSTAAVAVGTDTSPISSPIRRRDSSMQNLLASSPSGIRDDEQSISIQERVTHRAGWLPQEVRDQLAAMLEEDVLPYNAACRLVVELHGEVFYENLCNLMAELQRDLNKEDEVRAAQAKKEVDKEEKRLERAAKAAAVAATAEGGQGEQGSPAGQQQEEEEEEKESHDIEELSARLMSMMPPTETLQAMGFEELAILRCMLDSQLNEEDALNRMLSVENPEQFSTPLQDEDITRYAAMYGLIDAPHAGSGDGANGGSPGINDDGEDSDDEDRESARAFDPKVAQLMEMGFSRSEAKKALRGSGGSVDEAASALLGDPVALERGRQRTTQSTWYTELEDEIKERTILTETVLLVAKSLMNDPNCIADLWQDKKSRTVMKLLLKHFSGSLR